MCAIRHKVTLLNIYAENGKFAGGFRGGPFLGRKYHAHAHEDHAAQNATDGADQCCNESIHLDFSHITMTFTALAILVILGDDLSRVDKTAIISSLKNLQRPDGSYSAIHGGSENDMRFLYCACIISYIINDWSGVDVERALQFVRDSHSYDMGIAQGPGQEAHGRSKNFFAFKMKLLTLVSFPRWIHILCARRTFSYG